MLKLMLRDALRKQKPARSYWGRGVQQYAAELLDTYEEMVEWNGREAKSLEEFESWLLNGARNWSHYSWSGCALCYDEDIAYRLCTPSELKRTDNGRLNPNRNLSWLALQTKALTQAWHLLRKLWKEVNKNG